MNVAEKAAARLTDTSEGGVWRWRLDLTDDECDALHAARARGESTPAVVFGHKEWDRRYQLKRRREKKAA